MSLMNNPAGPERSVLRRVIMPCSATAYRTNPDEPFTGLRSPFGDRDQAGGIGFYKVKPVPLGNDPNRRRTGGS